MLGGLKTGQKITSLVTIIMLPASAVDDNAEMENLEILARNKFEYSTARDLKGITHTWDGTFHKQPKSEFLCKNNH